MVSCKISRNSEGKMTYNKRTVILNVMKDLFANFSAGHARLIDPLFLRMTGEFGYVMGRNEASIRELCMTNIAWCADTSFLPMAC